MLKAGPENPPAPSVLNGSTVSVGVAPVELRPTPQDVAQHAGGEGFALTTEMQQRVNALLPMIADRVRPRYSYAAHRVSWIVHSSLALANGVELPFGLDVASVRPHGLVAAVCTMGAGTDSLQAELGTGSPLDAWLLDATVLAELDLLESRCLQDVSQYAVGAGLFVGPALVPAVAGVPQPAQQGLFECIDAAVTGVALNELGVMTPLKSFSCWLPLVTAPVDGRDGLHLCERCDLDTCAFRRRFAGGEGGSR